MSYALDLALQQLADGRMVQCQQRPLLDNQHISGKLQDVPHFTGGEDVLLEKCAG